MKRHIALIAALTIIASGQSALPSTMDAPSRGTATFTLTGTPGQEPGGGAHRAKLLCDGRLEAHAVLNVSGRSEVEIERSRGGSAECLIEFDTRERPGHVNEVMVEVRSDADGAVVHRSAGYDADSVRERTFALPAGDVSVSLGVSALPSDQVGTDLRVMAFNIWQGGRLDGRHEHGFEEQNVAELVSFVRQQDPDVLFVVETYGSSDALLAALNREQPNDRRFSGVQVTRDPGQAPDRDNLWLFTHLPIEEVYPIVTDEHVTSFNFGGARLGLPDGQHIHAFSMWLSHLDNSWSPLTQAAMENRLGLPRTDTDDELLQVDQVARMGMAQSILYDHLPALVNDDAPVIIAGDANTQSHMDWSDTYADAPGHEGLVLDWPVMREFESAGFTDTYRHSNPDVARYPGRTWSPAFAYNHAPARIDYILTRGDSVRVLASSTIDRRLEAHRDTELDDIYPFYSDHAAVVSEILIRGTGEKSDREYRFDEPAVPIEWPSIPDGTPVPSQELTATASTENASSPASLAVDGSVRTHWHSNTASVPPTPQPHTLTIDLGAVRELSALRYVPRIDGYNGIVIEYTLEVSSDGLNFTEAQSGEWDRSSVPKDLELDHVEARYLRLVVHQGVGLFSTAAEIIPFEVSGA